MYKKGQILKSGRRTSDFPLFIMVCDNCTIEGDLDQTAWQFRAIVLFDASEEYEAGMTDNSWNKGRWIQSDLLEIAKAYERIEE